eukprot:GHUV01005501.1.p1 GENE.GHUV01005501.1~~GHUV01005501.1.p1  ORF type:complete len:1414 (+),score=216.11 GHUV01005501.1:611-4243(+)
MYAGGGGLMANGHAVVHVSDTLFHMNYLEASDVAGAAAMGAMGSATAIVVRSIFTANRLRSVNAGGAGLGCRESCKLSVRDSVFDRNYVEGSVMSGGTGVLVTDQGQVKLLRCNFTSNIANGTVDATAQQAGLVCGGAFTSWGHGKATIEDCFVQNCSCHQSGVSSLAAAGAIAVGNWSTVYIRNSVLRDNSVDGYYSGGGAIAMGQLATAVVSGTVIANNSATSLPFSGSMAAPMHGVACGGGILAFDQTRLTLDNNTVIANNSAIRETSGMAFGGGLAFYGTAVVNVTKTSLINNSVTCDLGRGGGAIGAISDVTLSVRDSLLSHNSAACKSGSLGGGIMVGDNVKADISHTQFEHNVVGQAAASQHSSTATQGAGDSAGGGLALTGNAILTATGSRFTNNTAIGDRSSGGGLYGDGSTAVALQGILFSSNHAVQGGGLSGLGVSWNLTDCTFANHKVSGYGGGVLFSGSMDVNMQGCSITNNRGSEGGGLYAYTFDAPFNLKITNTTIAHNTAMTGAGVLLRGGNTFLGRGVVINNNSASQQAGGVGWFSGCMGQGDCPSQLNVSCGAQVRDNTAAVAGGAFFIGDSSQDTFKLTEQCAITSARDNQAAFGDPNLFYISRECRVGEIAKGGGWCDACGVNMYSFSANATECSICPANAICPGRDVLIPVKGYWHSSRDSTQVHACPNAEACDQSNVGVGESVQFGSFTGQGNLSSMDWQCRPGYHGILCGKCSPGYGMTSNFKCGKCMSAARASGLFALCLLIILALLSYMSHATYQDNQQAYPDLRVSDVLKVFVLYVQYLTILGSAAVAWPKAVSYIFIAVGFILSSCTGDVISLDCIYSERFGEQTTAGVPLAELRQLTYLVLPFVMLLAVICAFGIFWGFRIAWKKGSACYREIRGVGSAIPPTADPKQHQQSQVNLNALTSQANQSTSATSLTLFYAWMLARVPVIVLVVLYFFYPSLVKVSWSQFSCKVVDVVGQQPYPEYATADAVAGYWVSDMQQSCWEGWHKTWALALGVPCVVVFCVGVPAGILTVLLMNRKRRDSPEFRAHFGFLMRNYKPSKCCWEVVAAMQTIVLVGVSVNGHVLGGFYEVVLFTAVFGAALVLNIWFEPFLFLKLQRTQIAALFCLCMTSFVSITFTQADDRPSVAAYRLVAGVLLLLINAAFICWCFVTFASVLWQGAFRQSLDKIIRRLRMCSQSLLQHLK